MLSPDALRVAPGPIAEHSEFARRSFGLVGIALAATEKGDNTTPRLGEELLRLLQVLESSLLVEEPVLIAEHVQWLRETGSAHGFDLARINAALVALADAMNGELRRAGAALRAALN